MPPTSKSPLFLDVASQSKSGLLLLELFTHFIYYASSNLNLLKNSCLGPSPVMDMLRDGKSGTSSPGVGPDGAARGGGSPGMRGGR